MSDADNWPVEVTGDSVTDEPIVYIDNFDYNKAGFNVPDGPPWRLNSVLRIRETAGVQNTDAVAGDNIVSSSYPIVFVDSFDYGNVGFNVPDGPPWRFTSVLRIREVDTEYASRWFTG